MKVTFVQLTNGMKHKSTRTCLGLEATELVANQVDDNPEDRIQCSSEENRGDDGRRDPVEEKRIIRQKIETPKTGEILRTASGTGYRFPDSCYSRAVRSNQGFLRYHT